MIPINPRPSEIFDLIEPVGGHKHSDGVVCVFVCYLDDSDSQLSTVATLAGYVSTLDEWKAFEVDTAPLFLCHGVDVLHAKEFHNTKGCFAGWSRIRKHSFVEELYDLVGEHVFFGVSESIRKSKYKRIKKETGKNPTMSAYGVCFAAIMHTVIRNNSLCDRIQQNGISFIVEDGHNNNAEIEKYFYKLRKHEMYQGIAREISFVGKDDSIAIQLADFFAFHSRRSSGLFDRFKGKLALPYSQIHSRMMDRVPHFEHIITNPYGRELTDWRGADWNR